MCVCARTHIRKVWKDAEQILRKQVVCPENYECGIKNPLVTLCSLVIFAFLSSWAICEIKKCNKKRSHNNKYT